MLLRNIKDYHLSWLVYIIILIALFFIALIMPSYYLMLAVLILSFIPIFLRAVRDILHKNISTDVFLIAATLVGILAEQQQAITVVLLIMLVAQYVESLIEHKTKKAALSLIKLMPTTVLAQTEQGERVIDIKDVKEGMRIICQTGQQIAVDGVIVDGNASINESFLTGESIPKDKSQGALVFAGTFILDGGLTVLVKRVGRDTFFGKVSLLLANAEQRKASIITVSNKAALIVVQALLVFTFLVWFFTKDLTLVATILIFGSPIELTLITPLAILAATAAAFRHGILVKGGLALERLAKVTTMIFDKTGTLTMGQLSVQGIDSFNHDYHEHDILRLAAMMEKRSGHILAKAIQQEAAARNLIIPDPDLFESVTGHGVKATYQQETYLLGSKHFIEAREHGNISLPKDLTNINDGSTSFYLCINQKLIGRIRLADTIREDAPRVINQLLQQGLKKTILLSGDSNKAAQQIAQKIGIHEAYGEMHPDEKLSFIKRLQEQGVITAMIGDGINDAPALSQADVGIAMGAMGIEPAIEASEIVLMANDLSGLVYIHALSKKVMRLIKQNIFLGFALIHFIGIVLALLGLISPIEAALFHAVSDLLILLNSARLIKFAIKR